MSISDAVDEPYGVKSPCPCCHLATIDVPGHSEVCPECGWEDDGQGDADADEVRGGPNGARSLTDARAAYQAYVAAQPDLRDSIAAGGVGLWWTMAMRQAAVAVPMPDFDFDAEPEWDEPAAG